MKINFMVFIAMVVLFSGCSSKRESVSTAFTVVDILFLDGKASTSSSSKYKNKCDLIETDDSEFNPNNAGTNCNAYRNQYVSEEANKKVKLLEERKLEEEIRRKLRY